MDQDAEEHTELVRYLRMVEFFKRSMMRWGAECCWLGRANDRLRELEDEVQDGLVTDWFDSERMQLLVRVRAYMNGLSEYRHAVVVANCRLVAKAAVVKHNQSTRGKGGKAKAAKTAEPKRKVLDAWARSDKRGRGTKTKFTTAQAALHGVSPRTIEAWLK